MSLYKTHKMILKKLFGSQVRVDLIEIFLRNPKKEFYCRQLERKINHGRGPIWKELKYFNDIKLIKKIEREGIETYFILNKLHGFVKPLKQIFKI